MTDKTLSKARGLNSIADPRSFKGASGRRRGAAGEQPPEPPPAPTAPPAEQREPIPAPAPVPPVPAQPTPNTMAPASPAALHPAPVAQPPVAPVDIPPVGQPIPQPLRSDSHHGVTPAVPSHAPQPHPQTAEPQLDTTEPRTPHRAVNPGINRKRRELSVPHVLADALERTGINPADVVMAAYRKHSHAIYAGEGGRMTAKGRTRLRLSISDAEFEQLTRLGQARGWNRSETVSVILAIELLGPVTTPSLAGGAG